MVAALWYIVVPLVLGGAVGVAAAVLWAPDAPCGGTADEEEQQPILLQSLSNSSSEASLSDWVDVSDESSASDERAASR